MAKSYIFSLFSLVSLLQYEVSEGEGLEGLLTREEGGDPSPLNLKLQ